MPRSAATGPLAGLKVLEFSAIGPVPLAAMLLSDMGADVVCVTRPGTIETSPTAIVSRGRRWVELDLKTPEDVAKARALVAGADILLEGFRPGVLERLGLGPEDALALNPRLVYGRMTGWGQSGPLAPRAGHDINYIAITGALDSIRGTDGKPVQPLNLVGDYGGGALYLLVGVLSALTSARAGGRGQVVDAAMCDGVVSLLSLFHSRAAVGDWREPGTNMLDGGAHYYGTYRCADGKYVSIGPIEPQFYAAFRRILGLTDPAFDRQNDRAQWPALKERMAQAFLARTRDEWTAAFEGSDACFAPVMGFGEAHLHPHIAARGCFVERDGVRQTAPAPRFSHTPSQISDLPMGASATVAEVAAEWGARVPEAAE